MQSLSLPPGLGANRTQDAQGDVDGWTQPILIRCWSCFSSSSCSLGVNLYCLAACGLVPGNKSMSISNPDAAEFGGGGPNVPPGALCLSTTARMEGGIVDSACGWCPGATCSDRYPFFLVLAQEMFAGSITDLRLATYKSCLPFLDLRRSDFISLSDGKNESRLLLAVV